MKTATTITTFAASFIIVSAALNAHAHGKKHDKPQYEATQTEFGTYDPALKPAKTINMSMSDRMRFSPDTLKVKVGDSLRIKLANKGQLKHEFVLGTQASLDEHAELMKKFPNMEHEEPYMAHVEPGNDGEIVWKFTQKGMFAFGCLIPGHYDTGMKGTVMVE